MRRELEPELMDLPDEAAAYARADFWEVNARFVARLLELAGDGASSAVDLGCGPGAITLAVARERPNWSVVGLDASQAMLDLIGARPANARFVLDDAKRPALGEPFDVVFSNSLLHHLPEPADFWAGVRALAKPGALVFVRDLFRPADEAGVDALMRHVEGESPLLQEEFRRSLLAAHTSGEIEGQLRRAGLSLRVETVSDRHVDVFGRT